MSQDMALRDPGDLVARVAAGRLTEAENVLVRRLVKLRQGQQGPSQEELALMVGEAQHLGLDVFAGECYFIKFSDAWECYPHWSGLVKIAEETGEYLGHRGPFYSDDGEKWVRGWLPDKPPPLCMVTVLRRDHEPTTVVRKYSRAKRETKNWRDEPEEQLAKATLRLALRRAFPREADSPISPKQLKALHTVAHLEGYGDRDERLAAASEIVGRPVESFKELSVAEATEVFETWAPEAQVEDVAGEITEPGHPPGSAPTDSPAATPQDDPQELAALRQEAARLYRELSERLASEWRPWFRTNVEDIAPGSWRSWPGSFGVAQLKELFERLDKVRPWDAPEPSEKQ